MSSSPSHSQTLAKRSNDTALMPPPPPPKRQKRPAVVVDEHAYADALSHIIARDFFPGLLMTKAQQEYLEALESNDEEWIRESGRKLTEVMTPLREGHRKMGRGTSVTPWRRMSCGSTSAGGTLRGSTSDTPGRVSIDGDHFAPEKTEVDVNMSLGAFQAKYTSEDNESFNALLDKQNKKRAQKYAFFHHGNQIPSARQLAHRARERKRLESGHRGPTAMVPTTADANAPQILSVARPSQDLDARPASVDTFRGRQGPRNDFMFGPEGVEDSMTTLAQQREKESNAAPKSVNCIGTRFPTVYAEAEESIPLSPSLSAINAAIAGRPRATASEPGYSGAETPRVNGYAFVDAEPSPSELRSGERVTDEEASAAEREYAKQFLPRVDEGGPSLFSIRQHSKREELLHRLVEKADASRRKACSGSSSSSSSSNQLQTLGIISARRSTTITTTTPSQSSIRRDIRKNGMTPAAQALAKKMGTPRCDGSRSMFGTSSFPKLTGRKSGTTLTSLLLRESK